MSHPYISPMPQLNKSAIVFGFWIDSSGYSDHLNSGSSPFFEN